MYDDTGNEIRVQTIVDNTKQVQIIPDNLYKGKKYTVSIEGRFVKNAEDVYNEKYIFYFKTKTNAPKVVNTIPENGVNNIGINPTILVYLFETTKQMI